MQSAIDAENSGQSVDDYVLGMMERKVNSYKAFNDDFPGFGGYLPWYHVDDDGIGLQWDWPNKVPSLDNGENIWSIVAAIQVNAILLLSKNIRSQY